MSMGGSGGSQTTTTTPWGPTQQYLKQIFGEAQNLYGKSGWTPEMSDVNNYYKSLFPDRMAGSQRMTAEAGKIADGTFDSKPTKGAEVGGYDVNMVGARADQGVLDPTRAYLQLLSGQVNNQYLDPLMQTVMTNINRNTQENVLPGINDASLGAGQYGSSRQGVAQGLAISRMNQDLSTGIAPIYATAFENAQNRMGTAADQINTQAERVATGNQERGMRSDMFNADMTMRLNDQNLAANQANMQNRLRASDLYGQAQNFQDMGFGQYQQLLGMPNTYNKQNLADYMSIMQPGAGMGGTSTQTAKQGRNPLTGAMGGAMAGMSTGNPWGAAAGGIMGLLSGLL